MAPIALAMDDDLRLEQYDLSSLRYILWGVTPVTAGVAERVTARTGVRRPPGGGPCVSESTGHRRQPVDRPDARRLDSCGLPPEGIRLRAAELETGLIRPAPGETGEIQVRSDSAMAGHRPAEANALAFTADGRHPTGDVGWLEAEGWVHRTTGPKKMIKVKGFQVAPAEIEAVLHGHLSGVLIARSSAFLQQQAGEVPVAAVALAPDAVVTAAELQQLVADLLAGHKRLHEVRFVAERPRLPSGKALRHCCATRGGSRLRTFTLVVRRSRSPLGRRSQRVECSCRRLLW